MRTPWVGGFADRKLQLDCEPKLYGSSMETSGPPWGDQVSDLDINVVDLPSNMTLEHIDKWTCGSMGISDHALLTVTDSGAQLDISRGLDGGGWLVVDAPPGTVHSCRVAGLPAVCVEQVQMNDYVMSIAYVFVLEDATLDPHGVVLRLWSEQFSVPELLSIAERIVHR